MCAKSAPHVRGICTGVSFLNLLKLTYVWGPRLLGLKDSVENHWTCFKISWPDIFLISTNGSIKKFQFQKNKSQRIFTFSSMINYSKVECCFPRHTLDLNNSIAGRDGMLVTMKSVSAGLLID